MIPGDSLADPSSQGYGVDNAWNHFRGVPALICSARQLLSFHGSEKLIGRNIGTGIITDEDQ